MGTPVTPPPHSDVPNYAEQTTSRRGRRELRSSTTERRLEEELCDVTNSPVHHKRRRVFVDSPPPAYADVCPLPAYSPGFRSPPPAYSPGFRCLPAAYMGGTTVDTSGRHPGCPYRTGDCVCASIQILSTTEVFSIHPRLANCTCIIAKYNHKPYLAPRYKQNMYNLRKARLRCVSMAHIDAHVSR